MRLHTVIAIEISLNEHLLKRHARIQKRLSGEHLPGYYGPFSETSFTWRFADGQFKLKYVDVCTSKVPLYDCIQSLRLTFRLLSIC